MSQSTFQSKEFKENLKKYEAAKANGDPIYIEPDDLTDIAEYYHMHGRLADAMEVIDLALSLFPGATQPLTFKARAAILLGHDADEAMRYANMIEDKYDLDYYYIVAEIMIADNRIEEADLYLDNKVKVVDPDDLEDFYLDVATLFADYDVPEVAERWLAQCQDTDEEDYQELQGRLEISRGDYKKSEKIFNALLDKDPYNGGYWNYLASSQYLQGDVSKSLESSDFSLAIDKDDIDALLNKANCLTTLGNLDEAKKYYSRYKQLQPQSEAGDMGLAAVLMAEDNLEESLQHWRAAEKLCSPLSANRVDIYRNLCFVYASLEQFDNAFAYVDKLEKMSGESTPDTLVLRGYLSLLAEKPDKANEYFLKAYKMTYDPEKDNTLWFIAFCYFDCNYMKEAHFLLRKLSKSENSKNFTDLWAYLVRTDYELGLQEEFLEDLKKATERNPYSIQRELSDIFPKGMSVRDFYNYAMHHPIRKK